MTRWNHWPSAAPIPPTPFVGTIIGDLTLAAAPTGGFSAYSPVNGFLYLTYGTGAAAKLAVCDLSGVPSVVTVVSLADTVSGLAYLPNSDKVFCLQSAHKYQLVDCATNIAAAPTTMTGPTFTSDPQFCSSFSVDPLSDDVYMAGAYMLSVVSPATGAAASPGYGIPSPGYADNLGGPVSIAYRGGTIYVATGTLNHMLFTVDRATWGVLGGLIQDFGATPVNITSSSKFVINRFTGHVYINAIGGTNKLYVLTNPTTLATISPANQSGFGDYDYDLEQVFITENTSPGFVDVYDDTDALLTHTDISGTMVNAPLAIYCAPECERYAVQKSASGEVLKVLGR